MQIMVILQMEIFVYKHVHLDYLHFQVQENVYHHVLLDFLRIKLIMGMEKEYRNYVKSNVM